MPFTLQNFYKESVKTLWGAGAGNFYVTAKPTPTSGYLVVNPSNTSKREIVRYSATGTDGGGDYVTISSVVDRGLGGTTAQTHAVGEAIRMNLTAQHFVDLYTDITAKYGPGSVIPLPTLGGDAANKDYVDLTLTGEVGTATDTTAGTNRMTKNQSSKPRARSTLVREQDAPNMTLKVESFRASFIDSIINFAGGNSPAFINPGFAGDLAIVANPSNLETVTLTINGTACVFTFVTSIGSTPGNILILGTAALTRASLATFIANPGTTNANQVAFTGAQLTALGLVGAVDDLSANLFIEATSATVTTFTGAETMAGGSNTWTANTTKNRLDLLVLSGGSLAIRRGVEAVSPVAPTPTTGDTVLCSVYNIPGETVIRDRTAALSGYISEWYDLAVYRTDLATTSQVPTTQVTYTAGESLVVGNALHYTPYSQNGSPVSFDSHNSAQFGSGSSNNLSLTVANNINRILVVDITVLPGVTVTGVTYNGASLTLTDSQSLVGSSNIQYSYRLINPSVGTFNVTVTTSGSVSLLDVAATSYYNVDQTTPVEVSVKSTTSGGGTFSQNITTLSPCALIHAGYAFNNSGGVATITFSSISALNLVTISSSMGLAKGNSPVVEAAQLVTIDNTHSGSVNRGIIALSLKPAVAASAGVVKASAAASTVFTTAKQDFVGFATQAVSGGSPVVTQVGLITTGLSGLTVGKYYYLQNTAGNIGLTPGTVSKIVAKALSTTTAIIIP